MDALTVQASESVAPGAQPGSERGTFIPASSSSAGGVWLRQEPSLPARARLVAAELAGRAGMSAERIGQIELAVTEVVDDLTDHAADGALLLRQVDTGAGAAVELLAVDHCPETAGPGRARGAGVSLAGAPSAGLGPGLGPGLGLSRGLGLGLGLGLGVVERMADSFDVHSLMNRGTVLVARFGDRAGSALIRRPLPEPFVAGLTRPVVGEQVCGDAWAVRSAGPCLAAGPSPAAEPSEAAGPAPLLVMLCDGLGHGPLAHRAAEQGLAAFQRTTAEDPEDVITEVHRALAGTRGGAVAVAAIDRHRRRITFCGIGNVSAFVVSGETRSTLLSAPGIAGHRLPRLRRQEELLAPGSTVVFHSDGLTERWRPAAMPSLFTASSTMIAAHLLREAGVRRDDASVVVVKDPETPGAAL